MKPKMQHQAQPLEIIPPQVQIVQGEVQQEIPAFLQAVNPYPARVAKEPRVRFQQHLSNMFAARTMKTNMTGATAAPAATDRVEH
jgi:hypothetical protein